MNRCSECEVEVPVPADAVQGEVVECPGCSVELEVIGVDPLELAPAPEMAEDWGE